MNPLSFLKEIEPIAADDSPLGRQVSDYIGSLAIPGGCLGHLHELSKKLSLIQKCIRPTLNRGIALVFAGDHGITCKGVSAFPKQATLENFKNMLTGHTVISAFANTVGLDVWYIDAGIDGPRVDKRLATNCRFIDARVSNGTEDCSEKAAMSVQSALKGLELGYGIAREACQHADAVIFGEMGIGNSSVASLISAALLGLGASQMTGRGSGLSDEGLDRKRAILTQALARRKWGELEPLEVLAELGGHEINALVGAMLGTASSGKPVLVDGFITTAAALVAVTIEPNCRGYLIPCTESVEFGYKEIAKRLDLTPLLKLGLRLGEGTGAALAWPIVQASASYLRSVLTFDDLGWLIKKHGDHANTGSESNTT
jgi:nicotinate-nucleotide--dimethylbenzimidazole phosphoribosyltransferase